MRVASVPVLAGLLALSVGAGPGAAVAEPPHMSVGWGEMTMTQEACKARAMTAMRTNGFTRYLEAIGDTTYSTTGDYIVGIRCAAEKTIVIFITSGPDRERTAEIQKQLRSGFGN
jgi:hypothetical protein